MYVWVVAPMVDHRSHNLKAVGSHRVVSPNKAGLPMGGGARARNPTKNR